MQGWLPLNEYSIKYDISLSTLRRRIRSNEIKFRFDHGKYWLFDAPTPKHLRVNFLHISDNELSIGQKVSEKIQGQMIQPAEQIEAESVDGALHDVAAKKNMSHGPLVTEQMSPLLQDSHEMLREIKSAFIKVLHEKEEQILLLKEEVSDLKTLVKILETENDRLKTNLRESAPIDHWLNQEL